MPASAKRGTTTAAAKPPAHTATVSEPLPLPDLETAYTVGASGQLYLHVATEYYGSDAYWQLVRLRDGADWQRATRYVVAPQQIQRFDPAALAEDDLT